jgi:hypothetical protein
MSTDVVVAICIGPGRRCCRTALAKEATQMRASLALVADQGKMFIYRINTAKNVAMQLESHDDHFMPFTSSPNAAYLQIELRQLKPDAEITNIIDSTGTGRGSSIRQAPDVQTDRASLSSQHSSRRK